MNLEHIKLFVRLATTTNISLAGRELGISPAVASAYLNKLEIELGVRLVHRTTRKVALTEEGLAFLPHAEEILQSVESARASVGSGDKIPKGNLRVTAPASFGRMHLIPRLNTFLESYPDIRIDLRLTDTIVDLVEGGYDVAIRNADLKDSTLIARKLAPDRRILTASPHYLSRLGKPHKPNDLLDHQCLTLVGLDNWVFDSGNQSFTIRAQGNLKTDNGEALRDGCVNGLGSSQLD